MKTHRLRVKLREATENAILAAAEEVASREGMAGASLQAIAEQAGIAVGTIYNYFEDKGELWRALFARRREELFEAIDAAAKRNEKQPFAAQLDAFVRAVFAHFDERRAFLRLAQNESDLPGGKSPTKHPALQQLQQRAERIMRVGRRDKQLRADETAHLHALVLVAMLRAVLGACAHDKRPFATETARVVSLFLKGAGR